MEHLDATPNAAPSSPRRRPGRPRKGEGPRVNYVELDQILVFGEPHPDAIGGISYPSYRELATRYGVAVSVIGDYGRKHKCQKRRKQAAARIRARADERQVEHRARGVTAVQAVIPSAGEALRDARQEILGELSAVAPTL
jgi:hypothetical protein